MNLKGIAAAVVGLLVVGTAVVIAGIAPLDGGQDQVTSTPESTGTVYEDSGTAADSSGDDGRSAGPPYSFTVQSIEKCGQTCRDVTVKLTNERNETATGVTIYTRIYAGNSTDASDKVWEGSREVGTLEAGASTTETQRVQLSVSDAYAVRQNDGWITILTTIESDDVTITFKQRRDVA